MVARGVQAAKVGKNLFRMFFRSRFGKICIFTPQFFAFAE
jgi:hypothetical protein